MNQTVIIIVKKEKERNLTLKEKWYFPRKEQKNVYVIIALWFY